MVHPLIANTLTCTPRGAARNRVGDSIMYRKMYRFIPLLMLLVAGCGGSGSSTDDTDAGDNNAAGPVVVTLPKVAQYPIVTEIQTLDLNGDALPDLLLA